MSEFYEAQDPTIRRLQARIQALAESGPKLDPSCKNYKLNKSNPVSYNTASHGSYSSQRDLNYKNYKGLYLKIHSDPLLKEAQTWGVRPEMLYSCIRDYGEYKIKETIQRLSPRVLADGYFRKNEPVQNQRGRLFSTEMKKLRTERMAG